MRAAAALQRLDHALGWTHFYTAMNAAYDAARCRFYAAQGEVAARQIAGLFRAACEGEGLDRRSGPRYTDSS